MKRTTSIFVISMIAMMVSGTVRAEVASANYVSEQINAKIEGKADKSNVYTKSELDTKLADKQDKALVTSVRAPASASDTSYPSEKAVATALDAKADKTQLANYATTASLNAVKATADSAVQPGDLAKVATSGAYGDLSGAPTIVKDANYDSATPNATKDTQVPSVKTAETIAGNAAWATLQTQLTSGEIADALAAKADKSSLATVATSGKYSDLTGTPTIDTALSTTSTNAVQNKAVATELAKKANSADIPTKTSQLTNDSNFATTTSVNAKVSTAQGAANAGKGLVVNTTGNLELQDIATQEELNAVSTTASNAATAAANAKSAADAATTAANGKQAKSTAAYQMGNASGGWDTMTAAQQNALNSGATTAKINQIATNTSNIATNTANIAKKQDTLTADNIKGGNNVDVSISGGVITISATDKDTVYTLPAATDSALGGVKSGGDISVAATGVVTVSHATSANTASSATSATKDASGNVITTTYATKTELGNKQDASTAVKHTANTAVGDATHPVYVAANGTATAITKVAAAATADSATTATTATNAKKICSGSACASFVDIWVE